MTRAPAVRGIKRANSTNDSSLLLALEEEIPVLEEKLKTMKAVRKRLRASAQMRKQRKDPAFNAATLAAQRAYMATPEAAEQRARYLRNQQHQPNV
jgi:hypothetical protein